MSDKEMLQRIKSHDAAQRVTAARELVQRYFDCSPASLPLAEAARLVAEVNRQTGDVATVFVARFLRSPDAWQKQTELSLLDWLTDVLCQAPEAKEEFEPGGLVDTTRFYLQGSPAVARRVLESGKPRRALLVSGAPVPSGEEMRLMEDLAAVEDPWVACRATFRLAHTYRIVHPRAAEQGWVLEEYLPPFRLSWHRFPAKNLPHRVWGWRADGGTFSVEDAASFINSQLLFPASLGDPKSIYRHRILEYESFRFGADDSPGTASPREATPQLIASLRFQLQPLKRLPWMELAHVNAIADRMRSTPNANP